MPSMYAGPKSRYPSPAFLITKGSFSPAINATMSVRSAQRGPMPNNPIFVKMDVLCRYERLASATCTYSGPLKEARKVSYKKGLYNAASFVDVMTNGKIDVYVIRVPGHATKKHWTPHDAYMMEREVQIIEYVRKHACVPVPQICTYSTDFDNILGHPYIMMTCLPGQSAHSIWFDEEYGELNPLCDFRFGDLPSPAVEKKRINFLRSLAHIMNSINQLVFHEIGMPMCPLDDSAYPEVGPVYQWDNSGSDEYTERPVFASTQEYVKARPRSLRMSEFVDATDDETATYILGARTLLDMIFAQPVFNIKDSSTGLEIFTLRHADLDLQNILVNEDGFVTGIIDWDRCTTVPRCIGAAAAPFFLQKDWQPAYLNNLETPSHLGFTTHRYHQIYAAALLESDPYCKDAKYTSKSAMYLAAIQALRDVDYGDVDDFLEKVLRCVPEFRGNVKEAIRAFGWGWPAGERIIERHLKQMFEPDIPDPNILKEADAYIAAMEWMHEFGYDTNGDTETEVEAEAEAEIEAAEADTHETKANTEEAQTH
ncbi:hypothetical protein E8E11_002164 [Didymella keratinophila]|nr:hypothetical protein E8E11_002164 [Didymella keratinophila]